MKRVIVAIGLALLLALACAAREIVVNSTADSGEGSLRWALNMAGSGDVITFDRTAFPPDDPGTIYPVRKLRLTAAGITIDASDAGVILNGRHLTSGWRAGLEILARDITIQGLQVVGFADVGIDLTGASHAVIGGDRTLGAGPLGHGNLVGGNGIGIDISDRSSCNTITGNLIGVGPDGSEPLGNSLQGVWIEAGCQDNVIGSGNVIAHNRSGIEISGARASRNTITQNYVFGNETGNILIYDGGNDSLRQPIIDATAFAEGLVSGSTCPGCTVEVFSSDRSNASAYIAESTVYLGECVASEEGRFSLRFDDSLVGGYVTATATSDDGSTSAFSFPKFVARSATKVPVAANEIIVTSTADNGQGTLRWALETVQSEETITFDPTVFPPSSPATIFLQSELPPIHRPRRGITIDGSNAGVIIDGRNVSGDWNNGLQIYSDDNTVMGLQVVGFRGSGIAACSASHTKIGGERSVGSGPLGQGNLLSGNGVGIDLCSAGRDNTITGNIIGTDVSQLKDWGNRQDGIWIENGISGTTIGPDNVIAHNGVGIRITGGSSVGNTITRNEIRDNQGAGIALGDGGNESLEAPRILDIDEDSGCVAAVACPLCTVELFSDVGATYEGQVAADAAGAFRLPKDPPFVGAQLVATATNERGTTSAFSLPTPENPAVLDLQQGNRMPRQLLRGVPFEAHIVNPVGGCIGAWESGEFSRVYDSLLASVRDLGIQWVRTGFGSPNPLNWQTVWRSSGDYFIEPGVDDFVTELANDGVNVVLTLGHGAGLDSHSYGESCWGNPGDGQLGDREPDRWFARQSDIDSFCDYATFMVDHFRGRIEYYEIWNEPSSGEYEADCRGAISVHDYASLLKQVVPLIRAADPEAKIIAGAIGRFNGREREWLLDLLRLEIGPLIDGLSWHPFYGHSPGQGTDGASYWQEYPGAVLHFMQTARGLGFTGDYFVEEMVWRTPTDLVPTELPFYTDLEAAKYAARAITLHTGLGSKAASNQLMMPSEIKLVPRYYVIKNLATALSGASPVTFPVRMEIAATPVLYCCFSNVDGDRLLAIWIDESAQDEHAGVPATIVLPNMTAGAAIGQDVLHGFEQELVIEADGEDTTISGLFIKDYPIIVRLGDLVFGADYEETPGSGFHRLGEATTAGGDPQPRPRRDHEFMP